MEKSVYMIEEDERYVDQVKFELELWHLFRDSISNIPFNEVAHAIIKAGLKLPY